MKKTQRVLCGVLVLMLTRTATLGRRTLGSPDASSSGSPAIAATGQAATASSQTTPGCFQLAGAGA